MAFDLVTQILVSFGVGGATAAVVLFIGKSWLAKSIEHTFNLKNEDYKTTLNKSTINFQSENQSFQKEI